MKPIIAVPATLALIYRAHSKKSLTPAGIFAATLTAVAHAVHPWNLPFVLLAVFFLAGTRVTHIKKQIKSRLTLPSSGASGGGEGPRTHVQVFANSAVASAFSLLHAYQLRRRKQLLIGAGGLDGSEGTRDLGTLCFSWGGDLLVIGIIANYACVAADTFSSELGILSRETPRLITSLTLRKVPRGTNGGVTFGGLAAGLLGSMVVVTTATLFLPMCSDSWTTSQRRQLMMSLVLWGGLGSVVDSVMGGLFQQSVRDIRSGKIIEGEGGLRVLVDEQPHQHLHSPLRPDATAAGTSETVDSAVMVDEGDAFDASVSVSAQTPTADLFDVRTKHRRPSFGDNQPSRVIENGRDLLDNNDVNFLMAFTMSVGAMAVAGWYWGVPLKSIFEM